MRAFLSFAALAASFLGQAAAAPTRSTLGFTPVHPGGVEDIIITYKNTVNSTSPSHFSQSPDKPQGTQRLPFNFVNNFGGGAINAYITGTDPSGKVVMVKSDGTFFYPSVGGNPGVPAEITDNVAIPLGGKGSTTSVTMPDYISAARIWFAEGNLKFYTVADGNGNTAIVEPSANNPADPSAGVNWGFVELTNNDSELYANISYVDFVGLVLGMTMTTNSGGSQTAPGLQAGAVASICNDLKAQAAKDGQPWDKLCQVDGSGNPLRITAPFDYMANGNGAFANYYNDYVNQVWSKYSSQPLYIDTQNGGGVVKCQVSGDTLNCDGDNRGYAKPSAADIFGCNSGPFGIQGGDNSVHYAVVPRLCAAFVRSTLLIDGGDTQPKVDASHYYTQDPTDHYSRIVHQYELQGKGYAFPYDDVNPSGGDDASGAVHDGSPKDLTIMVGGSS